MNKLWKETLYALLLIFSLILLGTLFINILYYFDLITSNITKYLKLFFLILSFFLGGIYMGKHSPNKGYLYGIRLSLLTILFTFLLSLILGNWKVTNLVYYCIIFFSITFASMIGINQKN